MTEQFRQENGYGCSIMLIFSKGFGMNAKVKNKHDKNIINFFNNNYLIIQNVTHQ